MKKKIMRMVSVIAAAVLVLCAIAVFGDRQAYAGNRCVIDNAMLKSAIMSFQGTTITKLKVGAAVPAGAQTVNINSDGTAVIYCENGVLTLAPATPGDTLAIQGNCMSLFSARAYRYGTGILSVLGNVTEMDLRGLDTSQVTSMSSLFESSAGNYPLEKIDIRGWNFQSVTDMGYMFNECSALSTLLMDFRNAGAKPTTMEGMFYSCVLLPSVDFTGLDTSQVTSLAHLFQQCSALANVNISALDTRNVTTMDSMFAGTGIKTFSFDGINTVKVTDFDCMFEGCEMLTSINLDSINTTAATTMNAMFKGCKRLTSIDLRAFRTEKVTNMGGMFQNCTGLTSINVSSFRTNAVTDFSNMFRACSSLTSLDITNFNTYNATTLGGMFGGCTSLRSIDLRGITTKKVTTMAFMFEDCDGLTSLDLSSFSCERLTSTAYMFQDCDHLQSVDLSGFAGKSDGSTVDFDMSYMFLFCPELSFINLTNLNTVSTSSHSEYRKYVFGYLSNDNEQHANTLLKHICMKGVLIDPFFVNVYGVYANTYSITTHQTQDGKTCIWCKQCWVYTQAGYHPFGSDGKCPMCGMEQTEFNGTNALRGVALSLKGNVEIEFYFELTDDVLTNTLSKVNVTFLGSTDSTYLRTHQNGVWDGKVYRVIRVAVPAKEMNSTVTVSITNNNGTILTTDAISVRQIAERYLQMNLGADTNNLIRAMLNYGAYSQKYFGYNVNNLANAGYVNTLPSAETVIQGVSDSYMRVQNYDTTGLISLAGCSLVLDDNVMVRYNFTFGSGVNYSNRPSFTGPMGLKQNGTYWYFESTDFDVAQWDKPRSNVGNIIVVSYSPFAYINDVMQVYSSGNLYDLARAMYAYWDAAQHYVGAK
ncbi:MAG: BspA family leucine-rich repeat surface protein [Lachnospiraceae bacterium]|nr:BspA family leucine-rich repeat surface protein [Lachnospiraceae bacterium]